MRAYLRGVATAAFMVLVLWGGVFAVAQPPQVFTAPSACNWLGICSSPLTAPYLDAGGVDSPTLYGPGATLDVGVAGTSYLHMNGFTTTLEVGVNGNAQSGTNFLNLTATNNVTGGTNVCAGSGSLVCLQSNAVNGATATPLGINGINSGTGELVTFENNGVEVANFGPGGGLRVDGGSVYLSGGNELLDGGCTTWQHGFASGSGAFFKICDADSTVNLSALNSGGGTPNVDFGGMGIQSVSTFSVGQVVSPVMSSCANANFEIASTPVCGQLIAQPSNTSNTGYPAFSINGGDSVFGGSANFNLDAGIFGVYQNGFANGVNFQVTANGSVWVDAGGNVSSPVVNAGTVDGGSEFLSGVLAFGAFTAPHQVSYQSTDNAIQTQTWAACSGPSGCSLLKQAGISSDSTDVSGFVFNFAPTSDPLYAFQDNSVEVASLSRAGNLTVDGGGTITANGASDAGLIFNTGGAAGTGNASIIVNGAGGNFYIVQNQNSGGNFYIVSNNDEIILQTQFGNNGQWALDTNGNWVGNNGTATSSQVKNVTDPSAAQDAVTMHYANQHYSEGAFQGGYAAAAASTSTPGFFPEYIATATNTEIYRWKAPTAIVMRALSANCITAPTGGTGQIFGLNDVTSSTLYSCRMLPAATSCTASGTMSVAANDILEWEYSPDGGITTFGINCQVEAQFTTQ